MENFVVDKLPNPIVNGIKSFISEKMEGLKSGSVHYNKVIREDILPLLNSQCTIVYYPKNDTDNNGFHKTYRYHGIDKHFVYINTNQDIEKQIFTAAHELGHVWKVDDYLREQLGLAIDYDLGERIMNRFAAELLMPEDLFRSFFRKMFIEKCDESNDISVEIIIQIITAIMNEFYVPYKAVVYRLYELNYFNEKSANVLWFGTDILPKEDIINYSIKYAKEQGYGRLYHPNQIKHIENLKELLDAARRKKTAPERWILEFYSRFNLEPDDTAENLKEELSVEKDEEIFENVGESRD